MNWIKIKNKLINLSNAKIINQPQESKLDNGGYYFSVQFINEKYANFNYETKELAEEDYLKLLAFISKNK